jgi:hypothetical protein
MHASTSSRIRRAAIGVAAAACLASPLTGFHWYSLARPADHGMAVGGVINGDMRAERRDGSRRATPRDRRRLRRHGLAARRRAPVHTRAARTHDAARHQR